MRWITLTLLVAFVFACLWQGFHRRRLSRSVVLGFSVLAALWAFAALAIASDWQDADGYIDCWPHCSSVQDTVGTLFFVAPAAAILLVSAASIGWFIRRRRTPSS